MKTFRYEVWALGYDKDDWCTDIEELIKEFNNQDEAVAFAKTIESSKYIFEDNCGVEFIAGDYLRIVVEKYDNEDTSGMSIAIPYTKVIPIII